MIEELSRVNWLPNAILPSKYSSGNFRCGFEGIGFSAPESFHRVKQVHGTSIETASERTNGKNPSFPEADGLWTEVPRQTIGIRTADCLPIVLADVAGRAACAIHAGWRGLAAGIVENALAKFVKLNVPKSQLVIAVGPSITLPNYEVGPEVVEVFKGDNRASSALRYTLYKGLSDRWQIDLAGIAAVKMLKHGIAPEQISVIRSCTFANSAAWNSYRREGRVLASNWAWVELTSPH